MYNPNSGYPQFTPTPSFPVYPKNSAPAAGMAYLGSPESALYRQPTPSGIVRGHTPYVGPNPPPPAPVVQQGGFARPGGVTVYPPPPSPHGGYVVATPMAAGGVVSPDGPVGAGTGEGASAPGSSGSDGQQPTPTENAMDVAALTNTKEKTPMCLINELARFNKITHQYCLTDEQGPAHKKTFFVKLKLGEEEFSASGPSIKKAQHAAAGVGLEQTKYAHPTPKRPSGPPSENKASNSSVTPTVELNALAMKRGEMAVYRTIDRKPVVGVGVPFDRKPLGQPTYAGATGGATGFSNGQRLRYPRPPHRFSVALTIGEREFVGEGDSLQAARHCAAAMALKVLNSLPMPTRESKKSSALCEGGGDSMDGLRNEVHKSEISLVHEIALKRNFAVEFEMVKESGPAHMRTFVTSCKCGELKTEGEGSSKRLSKKRAAERMVEELNKLPPLPPTPASGKPKKNNKPKQNKNLVKTVLTNSSASVNPISRLIQIQQAKKEKEPTFTLVEETGLPRAREFHIQVTVGDNSCTGVGSNKKLAKRTAAEQMLQLLGVNLLAPQPPKPAIKSPNGGAGGQAAAPGVEPANVNINNSVTAATNERKVVTFVDGDPTDASQQNIQPAGRRGNRKRISKNDAASSAGATSPMTSLRYVCQIINYDLQVNNHAKSETDFLSVITITSNATGQMLTFSGTGTTSDMADNMAAHNTLEAIRGFGLAGQPQGEQ